MLAATWERETVARRYYTTAHVADSQRFLQEPAVLKNKRSRR